MFLNQIFRYQFVNVGLRAKLPEIINDLYLKIPLKKQRTDSLRIYVLNEVLVINLLQLNIMIMSGNHNKPIYNQ